MLLYAASAAMFSPFLCRDVATADDAAVGPRPWPLPIEINLSSSFGEYRGGHLHAGVDVRTYGREGVPCRAVDSGHISRLRASPHGYGMALYLTLESGETVVYAHLAEFSPQLQAVLREHQRAANRYRVDAYFDVDSLRVDKGEVIGYSGTTGTSAPHLHFELRDDKQNPLNPLSQGWHIEDRIRPVADGAVWYPLTPHSTIEGRCESFEQVLKGDGKRTFAPLDTIVVSGRFGLSARIIDRINSTSGRLAPYSIEVAVNGNRTASILLEGFTYDHTREVELAYDMSRVRAADKHYLMLYQRPGETLWHRDYVDGGVVDTDLLAPDKVHLVEVTTADRAGNTSVIRIPFRVGTTGYVDEPRVASAAVGTLTGAYVFDDLISLRSSLLSESCRERLDAIFPLAGLGGAYRARVADLPEGPLLLEFDGVPLPPVHVLPLRSGRPNALTVSAHGVSVRAGRSALYGDAVVWVAAENSLPGTERTSAELLPVSSGLAIGPVGLTLRAPIELRWLSQESNDERRALYVYNLQRDRWYFMPSTIEGDTLVTDIRGPGIFAVFIDDTPPAIGRPATATRTSYATQESHAEISVPIDDTGCGLDDDLTEVYLDGIKQVARWDGFSKKMFVTILNENIIGSRELSIIAVDKVGNVSQHESTVQITQPETEN